MDLPEITIGDVEAAARSFQCEFRDEREAILRRMDTADVRACPGSGKTTLLAAKLAILAPRWNSRSQGICILSHTNVARREIQSHFGVTPELERLTTYPHFLGTVQSFIDTFLGIPAAVRKFGKRPVFIDNDTFEENAKRRFKHKAYSGAQRYLGLRQNGEAIISTLTYSCSGGALVLGSPQATLPKEGSTTHTQLTRLKASLSQSGYFRFEDMTTLAEWLLGQFPILCDFLAHRFPLVFVDEMQDTVSEQAALIDRVFGGRSVLQRFGDDRQAIFHGSNSHSSPAAFPRGVVLPMRRSYRLSPSIARLAENVCAGDVEQLIGNPERPDRAHTVFLFCREHIDRVLPAFANLVAEQVGTGSLPGDIRAVGAIAKANGKFPGVIGDYWPQYVPHARQSIAHLQTFHAFFRKAQAELASQGSAAEGREVLLGAAARLLRIQGVKNGDRPFTPTSLTRWLRLERPGEYRQLTSLLGEVSVRLVRGDTMEPREAANRLSDILGCLHKAEWKENARAFLTGDDESEGSAHEGRPVPRTPKNVFITNTAAGRIAVQVDTIHSVKGETVRAILVLETFFRNYDLKALTECGYLTGSRAKKSPGSTLAEHVKRTYVAMTRPADLLCLAILDEHLSPKDRVAMQQMGWRFVDL